MFPVNCVGFPICRSFCIVFFFLEGGVIEMCRVSRNSSQSKFTRMTAPLPLKTALYEASGVVTSCYRFLSWVGGSDASLDLSYPGAYGLKLEPCFSNAVYTQFNLR